MVINKKEKVFTKRDFLASETLGLGCLWRLFTFVLVFFAVTVVSSIYIYFMNKVEVSLFEFITKVFGSYFNINLIQTVKQNGVYLFIILIGLGGLHFFKRQIATWHANTPVLTQPLLLNWDTEVLIIRSLNEELISTFYWKDFKNAKKTSVGVNLYLSPVYPIRIPFDWFDDEDNKQNFLQLVKIATGKTIN